MTFDCILPKFPVQQNFHDLTGTHRESDGATTDGDTCKHRCVCGEDRRTSVGKRRHSEAFLSYGGFVSSAQRWMSLGTGSLSPPPGAALNLLSLRVGCCVVGAEPPTAMVPLSAFLSQCVSCDERGGRDRCAGVRGHVRSHSVSSSYRTHALGHAER